jgi:hypothetical protein
LSGGFPYAKIIPFAKHCAIDSWRFRASAS